MTDLKLGFGEPLDMLQILHLTVTFILLQNKSFGQNILNFMHGFKSFSTGHKVSGLKQKPGFNHRLFELNWVLFSFFLKKISLNS